MARPGAAGIRGCMSVSKRHFILFRDISLMYARVPKVANSSIKASLCRLLKEDPDGDIKTTSDRFWKHHTHGETSLITPEQARRLRTTHFSFSFVRNPFDRLVAAYNNKLLEIDDVPRPMKQMGLHHGMPFPQFIDILCRCDPEELDNHVRPQSDMLIAHDILVPKFVGRMEHINEHWHALRRRMKKENLPALGRLPRKNIRRQGRSDILERFNSTTLIDAILQRYARDFEYFYSAYSVDNLLQGDQLVKHPPLQRLGSQPKNLQLYQHTA